MSHDTLSRGEFDRLVASGYNQVPLIKRVACGGLTPTALVAAAPAGDRILLESTQFSEPDGRYSVVVSGSSRSSRKLTAKGSSVVVDGLAERGNPMEALRRLMHRFRGFRPEGAPLFCGGAIGYFGYACGRYFEDLPAHAVDDAEIPDLYLLVVDHFVTFDHHTRELLLIASGDEYATCHSKLRVLEAWIECARANPRPAARVGVDGELASFRSNFSPPAYETAIRRIHDYIKAGDVYQVNLSQRLEVPVVSGGLAIYETLSRLSPVHFASYIALDTFEIVCASPERLVRLDKGRLTSRPIAGTRRRGTPEEDERFMNELLTCDKELSEHSMLIDLARNDLGRVSQVGSVKVTRPMAITKYAHVMHLESEVEGELDATKDFLDVLRATFPGGTVTGVPKLRTIEVIAELEPNERGVYTGSIGYISFAGGMDLNIVIRTILIKNKTAYANVGGGIVWDSVPEQEYKETMNKARSQLLSLAPHCRT